MQCREGDSGGGYHAQNCTGTVDGCCQTGRYVRNLPVHPKQELTETQAHHREHHRRVEPTAFQLLLEGPQPDDHFLGLSLALAEWRNHRPYPLMLRVNPAEEPAGANNEVSRTEELQFSG